MARGAGDGWTRLVRFLRIALPLLALALLSTVFLVARHLNPDDALPYSEVDIADRLREPRMTNPVYSGTTADGADLRVTAEAATPEQPGTDTTAGTGAAARKVLGILTTPDGIRTDLRSLAAQMDVTGDSVTFAGGVDLDNGGGYRVQTDSMVARMDMTEVRSLAPVTATGPGTHITAREMVLTQDPTRPNSYVLVFTGQVKLVYDPPK
jgi:lipopolysaccharide export system protein LptC